jgi:hypothetical protein
MNQQLTLIEGKITYSMEGAVIDPTTSREELKDGWMKVKALKAASVKIENDLRLFAFESWGPDEAVSIEGEIITELGFLVKFLKSESEKDHSFDLPTTDAFIKSLDKLAPRWEWAIKQGNVEYLQTVHRALAAAVEIHHRIGRFLHVNRSSN